VSTGNPHAVTVAETGGVDKTGDTVTGSIDFNNAVTTAGITFTNDGATMGGLSAPVGTADLRLVATETNARLLLKTSQNTGFTIIDNGDIFVDGNLNLNDNILMGAGNTVDGRDVSQDGTDQDNHIGDSTKHRIINDLNNNSTELWSANKINSELDLKYDKAGGVITGTIDIQNNSPTIKLTDLTALDISNVNSAIAMYDSVGNAKFNIISFGDNMIINNNGNVGDMIFQSDSLNLARGFRIKTSTQNLELISVGLDCMGNNIIMGSGLVDNRNVSLDGTNQDNHIADVTLHHIINDGNNNSNELWSANKINTELGTKINSILIGANNGVAPLDAGGIVPLANLPVSSGSDPLKLSIDGSNNMTGSLQMVNNLTSSPSILITNVNGAVADIGCFNKELSIRNTTGGGDILLECDGGNNIRMVDDGGLLINDMGIVISSNSVLPKVEFINDLSTTANISVPVGSLDLLVKNEELNGRIVLDTVNGAGIDIHDNNNTVYIRGSLDLNGNNITNTNDITTPTGTISLKTSIGVNDNQVILNPASQRLELINTGATIRGPVSIYPDGTGLCGFEITNTGLEIGCLSTSSIVPPNPMTNHTTTVGYVVSSSAGELDFNRGSWRAFDFNLVSEFVGSVSFNNISGAANSLSTLNLEIPTALTFQSYRIYRHDFGNWTIESSNDNSSWTVRSTETGNTNHDLNQWDNYTISNPVSAKYWRINVTLINAPVVERLAIAQLEYSAGTVSNPKDITLYGDFNVNNVVQDTIKDSYGSLHDTDTNAKSIVLTANVPRVLSNGNLASGSMVTTSVDNGTLNYNGVRMRYDVSIDGYYKVDASIDSKTAQDGTELCLYLGKNNTATYYKNCSLKVKTRYVTQAVQGIIQCIAGDWLCLMIETDTNETIFFENSNLTVVRLRDNV